MLIYLSVLIGICSLAILIAGLLAFLRNPHRSQNRWFLAVTACLSLWLPFNFIDSNVSTSFWTNFALKADIAIAPLIAWTLLGFVRTLEIKAVRKKSASHFTRLFTALSLVLNVVIIIASLFGVFATASVNNGDTTVTYGSPFAAYVITILFYFVYAFGLLFYKRAKARASEQGALNLIAGGLMWAVLSNILSNVVVPSITTNRETIQSLNIVGYSGFVVFVLCIYLAITTQKLFDIRLVVARALGYVLSLGSLAAIFLGATLGITDVLFANGLSSSATRFIYLAFAVIFALIFPPLKRFFDKATNTLFYRDAYDPQAFIDELNKVMVSNYEITALLRKSADVIESNLKPQFSAFAITETASSPERIIGTETRPTLSRAEVNALQTAFSRLRHRLVVADTLDAKNEKLKQIFEKNNIAAAVRIASASADESGIGYLLFGPKKSGNPYSSQDLNIMITVANGLAVAVQNALRFEEIKNFNLTLQEKVVEATRKLRHTNEKLKALDETKDDFISMASHQLRTPLTSVKGYISMVLEGDAGKLTDMQKDMLNQAFFSSQRMVFLIADLLNVSRLKTGKFVIEPIPLNLAKLVGEELEQLKDTAASRGLSIQFDGPENFPDLMLDETKTRQVIMNFVDNAIYYTPAGGQIVVNLAETSSSIELRVTDNGIGVPKSEQHHLFNKFYRAANARKARPDGTGLGLFMAKKVIVGQGGSVIFESTEGKGSTFGFIFSKGKLQVKTAPTPVAAAPDTSANSQKA